MGTATHTMAYYREKAEIHLLADEPASRAYIEQLWAVGRLITGTQLPAVVFLTELTTVNAGVNRFCWAKIPTQTRGIQDTVIPALPEALLKHTVTFYLP